MQRPLPPALEHPAIGSGSVDLIDAPHRGRSGVVRGGAASVTEWHRRAQYVSSRGMVAIAVDYRVRSRNQSTLLDAGHGFFNSGEYYGEVVAGTDRFLASLQRSFPSCLDPNVRRPG